MERAKILEIAIVSKEPKVDTDQLRNVCVYIDVASHILLSN